nr:MAG TPA: hypothetical protein [Caudoviricetes sp.]
MIPRRGRWCAQFRRCLPRRRCRCVRFFGLAIYIRQALFYFPISYLRKRKCGRNTENIKKQCHFLVIVNVVYYRQQRANPAPHTP